MNRRHTTIRRASGRSPGRGRTVAAALIIIVAGIAVALYPNLTDLRYEWAQWRLAASAGAQASEGGAGSGEDATGQGAITLPEGAVARLEIPAIDVEAYVVEGTGTSSLARGPGHYPGTSLPGEAGNAAIAGHRTMYGHVFHDLDKLAPGDEIRVGTSRGEATYRVVQVSVVDPGQTEVVAQTDDDRLTLTTCHPKGSAAQRLVVVAERTH